MRLNETFMISELLRRDYNFSREEWVLGNHSGKAILESVKRVRGGGSFGKSLYSRYPCKGRGNDLSQSALWCGNIFDGIGQQIGLRPCY